MKIYFEGKESSDKIWDIQDIICNLCNKSCRTEDGASFEYAELQAKWGFYSQEPNRDLESHSSHLCQPCYEVLIYRFHEPPDIKFYDTFTGEEL